MGWRWQTMNYTAETMRDFLRDYLGPELKGNQLTSSLKVMILDDGRGLLPGWADTVFNDSKASEYADGVAVHWYGNLYSPAVLLDITQRRHPDKFIFGTEVRIDSLSVIRNGAVGYNYIASVDRFSIGSLLVGTTSSVTTAFWRQFQKKLSTQKLLRSSKPPTL